MSITTGQTAVASDFINQAQRNANPANDSGRVPKLEANGRLDEAFLPDEFGDGSDGSVTISSPTSLTRDMYYDSLVVNNTLTTNGYRIFVKGTLSGSGTIKYPDGNAGSNGSATAGAGGAAYTAGGPLRNTAGANGGDSSAGGAGSDGYIGSAPGAGGNPGALGGAGGVAGAAVNSAKFGIERWMVISMLMRVASGVVAITPRGAGGGGGDNSGNGAGGGGGASGGVVWIAARNWGGTFTISAIGGNGGNGGSGGNYGGGGGGGAGGTAVIIHITKTWTGSYSLTGGTGGAAGGVGATAGGNGATGTSYELRLGDLL